MKSPDFIDWQGARTHETHVTTKHIEKLRQLINAVLAKPFAERGDARVLAYFEDRATHLVHGSQLGFKLFGVSYHSPELVNCEWLAIEAGTSLTEQDRARGSQFYQESDYGGGEQKNDQKQYGSKRVKQKFK